MLQDLRFAFRLIAKDRWFTAVVVVALGLGIGLNATVFTLVNAVLIRGLPFPDSGSLYMLGWQGPRDGNAGISPVELDEWRAQSRSFAGLAAFRNGSMNIADDRALPEQARGAWLTTNAFSVLGQQPMLGRDFLPSDGQKGAEHVVILGYTIWKNRYGGDPNVIGRTLRLNGTPATVVGVMPDAMQFPSNADLWAVFVPANRAQEQRTWRALNPFGRVRPGVSRAQAQAEMNTVASAMVAAHPEAHRELKRIALQTFNERFNGGEIRVVFLSMMGAVGFVLLIACANVANLLLSRSANRAREISVRVALGATRARVVRQLLVESVLLGLMGGVIGLLLTLVGIRMFDAAVAGTGKPYWIVFSIDYLVVAYLAGICVLTGLVFGLAPALQVSRTNINEVLKEGGRGTAGGRRVRWMSGTMVVVELALTIVLLVGAGLMVRSFLKLYTLDMGYRTENLMAMRLHLFSERYQKPEERRAFFDRLMPQVGSVPGIEGVAITTSLPPFGAGGRQFEVDGAPARAESDVPLEVSVVTISPGLFELLDVPVRRGRAFGEADGAPGNETVIINERAAAQYFAGRDPIGQRVRFVSREPVAGQPVPVWRTVVGVSAILRHSSPQDREPSAVFYLPHRQDADPAVMLVMRSRVDPATVMNAVRREVQAIDQDQPVFTIQTLDQMLSQSMWPYRVFGSLFAIFAVIGLVLSAVGLYAVMAYSVTERRQEIGVRMALGAAGAQVSWLVLRRGLLQLAIGLAVGLGGALALSRVMRSLLVQITPTDPITFVAVTALLSLVATAACVIPARRATRIDPLIALR